jgi:hypothetical protein
LALRFLLKLALSERAGVNFRVLEAAIFTGSPSEGCALASSALSDLELAEAKEGHLLAPLCRVRDAAEHVIHEFTGKGSRQLVPLNEDFDQIRLVQGGSPWWL